MAWTSFSSRTSVLPDHPYVTVTLPLLQVTTLTPVEILELIHHYLPR